MMNTLKSILAVISEYIDILLKQDYLTLRCGGPKLATLLIASVFFVTAHSAHAVVLLSNNPGTGLPFTGTNDIFAEQWNSAAMTTGTSGFTLDSVAINAQQGTFGAGASAVVEIYDDSGAGGTAGSSLITLGTTNVLGASLSNLTYTPGSTFFLAPLTTYWVVVKGAGAPGVTAGSWVALRTNASAYTGDASVLAATNKTQYFCNIASSCATSSWLLSPGSPGGNHDFGYAVSGTLAVPEPATVGLLVIGIFGMGRAVSRRQRA